MTEPMKTKLSVMEFSMLPLQAGLEIETPNGIGTYEGITSSGIVKVFLNGGFKEFSWSECNPKITLRHIILMEEFVKKWKEGSEKPRTIASVAKRIAQHKHNR